jgi:OOP family OmpA-OmpF porin
MRKLLTSAVALAALAAMPLTASAQYRLDEGPGFYAGGTLGWNNDDEAAWRLLGGYQVNRNFAAELGYHDLGQHNIAGHPLDSNAWELVGVGRLPFGERFAAYGKLGAYRANSTGSGIDETSNDLTFGAGIEYALSRNLSARGEWQRYRDIGGGAIGQVGDLDVYSVGVVYRFR